MATKATGSQTAPSLCNDGQLSFLESKEYNLNREEFHFKIILILYFILNLTFPL